MKHRRQLFTLLLLTSSLVLGACPAKNKPNQCVGEPSIVPGVGVRTPEGQWCLGAPASAINQAVGAANATWDLGLVGHRAAYPDRHLTALYTNDDNPPRLKAVYLDEGVTVRTEGGVGLGSTGADVRAELGEPVLDPFLGVWWYRDQGIAFTLTQDRVTRIQIFAAVSPLD